MDIPLFFVESFNSYRILGSTRDDAAGEAFDKAAKLLGLGYPGGASIDRRSQPEHRDFVHFPRALINHPSYEFSFSGIKTAVRNYVQQHHKDELDDLTRNKICSSIQEAIVDVLVQKTVRAAVEIPKVQDLVIAGGVSANSRLRSLMTEQCATRGLHFVAPRMSYSLDNAAMIALLHIRRFESWSLSLQIYRL